MKGALTGDAPDAGISSNATRPSSGPTCYRKCSFICFIQAVLLSRPGKHISLDASPVKEIKNKGQTGGASFPCQSVKEKQCQSGRPIALFHRCLPLRCTSALEAPCFLPLVPLRWFIAASVCCQSCLPLAPPTGPTSLQSSRKTSSVSR